MKRKNKKKLSWGGLSLRKNKKFFGVFVAVFSLIIIVNATLAWSSYSEWVKNHTQSNPESVAVKVTETFKQESILSFKEETEKSVKVKNLANRNAIIRVRFYESVLPFEMDMTDGEGNGNGNIKLVKDNGETKLNLDDLTTWESGNILDSGLKDGADPLYYQADSPVIINQLYTGETDRSNVSRPVALQYFSWSLNPAVHSVPQNAVSTPYWVFDGEYFYYSQVLESGETTTIDLLQSVILSNINIPNQYKQALYDIEIEAEGVEATQRGLQTWTNDGGYLTMYQEDTRFK
ncbi:hypothetical protein ACYSNU_16775 [Enterococcus sp. LJL120]